MIMCPTAGRPAGTGWFISADTLATLDESTQAVHCDQCHQPHDWTPSSAILETL